MLLSSFIILLFTLVFSFFAVRRSRKNKLGNNNILYIIILYFISCALTIVSSSIYSATVASYQSNISIDMSLLFLLLRIPVSPWQMSRIFNISVALFMLICVFNIMLIKKRNKVLCIPLIALIFVFVYINDYTTSWNIYSYINTTSSPLLQTLVNNIAEFNNIMLLSYMAIPLVLAFKESQNTKLKFKKKYYSIFTVCILLIDAYYLIILNVFFKAVRYSNISFSKLPINQVTSHISDLSILTTFILIFGIAFIAVYYPLGNLLIVSKRKHVLDAKNISNNLNMILHTYKNAFVSINRIATTITENAETNSSEMILACTKTLNKISDEQLAIINKTLSLTRINDFTCKKINLVDVINTTTEEIIIPPSIDLSFTSESPSILIWGDIYYLKEAFKNIVENAITALENTDKDKKLINIKCYLDNEFAITEIYDNGCGIKSSDIKKIFDLYSSSKPRKNCGGIGLYFVQTIINLHNGVVEVSSTPDESTTFTIILPIR